MVTARNSEQFAGFLIGASEILLTKRVLELSLLRQLEVCVNRRRAT
jgi:hypothetical protein